MRHLARSVAILDELATIAYFEAIAALATSGALRCIIIAGRLHRCRLSIISNAILTSPLLLRLPLLFTKFLSRQLLTACAAELHLGVK